MYIHVIQQGVGMTPKCIIFLSTDWCCVFPDKILWSNSANHGFPTKLTKVEKEEDRWCQQWKFTCLYKWIYFFHVLVVTWNRRSLLSKSGSLLGIMLKDPDSNPHVPWVFDWLESDPPSSLSSSLLLFFVSTVLPFAYIHYSQLVKLFIIIFLPKQGFNILIFSA